MRRGVALVAAGLLLLLPSSALADEAPSSTAEAAPEQVGIGTAEAVQADGAEPQPATSPSPTPSEEADGSATERPARTPTQDPSATESEPDSEVGIGDPAFVECLGTVRAVVVDLDGAPVAGSQLMVGGQSITGSGEVELPCGEVTASLLNAPDGYGVAGADTHAVAVRPDATTTVTFTVDPVEVLGVQIEQPTPEAAPSPSDPVAAPEQDAAPAELAATGPEQAPVLLVIALLCGVAGGLLLHRTRPLVAAARASHRRA